MTNDQIDLFGERWSLAPPADVPPVILHAQATGRKLGAITDPVCAHCIMTSNAIRRAQARGIELAEPWRSFPRTWSLRQADIRITQTDGSTLDLCDSHAKNHLAREGRDG